MQKKQSQQKVNIEKLVNILEKDEQLSYAPVVSYIANLTKEPFQILISCILSLRTKDRTTAEATNKLFKIAKSPDEMVQLSANEIENLIYPAGFYRTKAKRILEISKVLIEQYNGLVPDDLDQLMRLPGVGRKTANLVITEAYDKHGICVDTHVHRIMNRLGYIKTKTPKETEFELRKKLPLKYWKKINSLLVKLGQTICLPISPLCSKCKIIQYCNRIAITRSR